MTTTSLSKDEQLTQLLKSFLGANESTGVRNLLDLAEIKSSIDLGAKGEKPLLITDYLVSNFNTNYGLSNDQDVQLNEDTKIVITKKAKKPEVVDYTCDIWSAANARIWMYLINSGAPTSTLLEYAEYSAMLADFLGLYVNHGVYQLDEQHRYRVAKEGRKWNDICQHDERRFLRHLSIPDNISSITKKPTKSRTRRKVVLDEEGRSVCWNFNSRKGCETTNCHFSHNCANCSAKHGQQDCPKPKQIRK